MHLSRDFKKDVGDFPASFCMEIINLIKNAVLFKNEGKREEFFEKLKEIGIKIIDKI